VLDGAELKAVAVVDKGGEVGDGTGVRICELAAIAKSFQRYNVLTTGKCTSD
jgi:hypothetical protein